MMAQFITRRQDAKLNKHCIAAVSWSAVKQVVARHSNKLASEFCTNNIIVEVLGE